MTTKNDFDEQEWTRIIRAPFVAGLAITLADPGGPIEAGKESMASMKSATNPPSHEQLLTEVALDIQAQLQQHRNPLKGFKPEGGRPPGEQVLDELRHVLHVVKAKADPAEATAFADWIVQSAQAAADAAREGGFMGFGAERVSQREKDMMAKVRAAVTS